MRNSTNRHTATAGAVLLAGLIAVMTLSSGAALADELVSKPAAEARRRIPGGPQRSVIRVGCLTANSSARRC